MIYPVFSIKDIKGDFWSPRIEQNEASARRSFAHMVNEDHTLLGFAPDDFELYYIGDFDSNTGAMRPLAMPEFVVRGIELVGVKHEK